MKYEVKRDCLAYDEKKHNCKALNNVYCRWENCKFYKTRKRPIGESDNGKK